MTVFYILLGAAIAATCASGWIYGLYFRGEAKGLRGNVKWLGDKWARSEELLDSALAEGLKLAEAVEKAEARIELKSANAEHWRDRYVESQKNRVGDLSGGALRDLVNRMQLDLPDQGEDRGAPDGGGSVEDPNGGRGETDSVSKISPGGADSGQI